MALLWLLAAGPVKAANGFDDAVAEVYRLFNAARLAAGVTAYVVEPGLQASAEAHALDMADNGCFTYTSCDGTLSWDARLRSYYPNGGNLAEIIAGDFRSPSEVVSAWLADPFGRAVILAATYRAMGLGWASVPGPSGGLRWTADFASAATSSAVVYWQTGYSGAWNTPGAWSDLALPNFIQRVVIDAPRSIVVHGPSGPAKIAALTLGSSDADRAGSGSGGVVTLQLNGGGLTVLGDGAGRYLTVGNSGVLTGDGLIDGLVLNRGLITPQNLVLAGGVNNEGLITGSGRLKTDLSNTGLGRLRTGAGESLQLIGLRHSNAGSVEVSAGGVLEITGTLANSGQITLNSGTARFGDTVGNAADGRIFLRGSALRFAGGLANAGQLGVSFGSSDVFGALETLAGGRIVLSGNSNTTFYDTVEVQDGGELRVSGGSTAVFFGPVQQRSGSVFSGAGAKFYEGGLSIGNSPGLGIDSGDVTFGSGNTYLEEIGGAAAGTQFDQYVVAGTLHFGGRLKIVWWGGFVGQAGQHFDLFDWRQSDGRFSAIDLSAAPLPAGLGWDMSQLYSTGEIGISAVPEPASAALLLLGGAALGIRAATRRGVRRRCRSGQPFDLPARRAPS